MKIYRVVAFVGALVMAMLVATVPVLMVQAAANARPAARLAEAVGAQDYISRGVK
jgi:hypothetical protein